MSHCTSLISEEHPGLVWLRCRVFDIQNLSSCILLSLEVDGELVLHLAGRDAHRKPAHHHLVMIVH